MLQRLFQTNPGWRVRFSKNPHINRLTKTMTLPHLSMDNSRAVAFHEFTHALDPIYRGSLAGLTTHVRANPAVEHEIPAMISGAAARGVKPKNPTVAKVQPSLVGDQRDVDTVASWIGTLRNAPDAPIDIRRQRIYKDWIDRIATLKSQSPWGLWRDNVRAFGGGILDYWRSKVR